MESTTTSIEQEQPAQRAAYLSSEVVRGGESHKTRDDGSPTQIRT
jgi:hypothetical protein